MHGSMRRREETRPVGKPVRPRRLPPTLPPPTGGLRPRNALESMRAGVTVTAARGCSWAEAEVGAFAGDACLYVDWRALWLQLVVGRMHASRNRPCARAWLRRSKEASERPRGAAWSASARGGATVL